MPQPRLDETSFNLYLQHGASPSGRKARPGSSPVVYLSGFTTIIDLAFAPNPDLYVLEHTATGGLTGPGRLWRVPPGGAREPVSGPLSRTLVFRSPGDGVYEYSTKPVPEAGDCVQHTE